MLLDLYNKKYSREVLKSHIYAVSLLDILITQTLDATFVVRYILNPKYQFLEKDQTITSNMVLQYQPHISKHRLIAEQYLYTSDDDSVEDFETISNKTSILTIDGDVYNS